MNKVSELVRNTVIQELNNLDTRTYKIQFNFIQFDMIDYGFETSFWYEDDKDVYTFWIDYEDNKAVLTKDDDQSKDNYFYKEWTDLSVLQ